MAEPKFTPSASSVRLAAEAFERIDRNVEHEDDHSYIDAHLRVDAVMMLTAYADALELYKRQHGRGTWGDPEAEHEAAERWRQQGRDEVKQAVRRALRPKRKKR